MTWNILIPIIAQYGIPLAESLFTKWTSGKVPTADDFAELKALAAVTAKDEMTAQLNAAGIPLTSPQGIAMLALVP